MKKKCSILLNLFIGLASFGAWLFMAVLSFDNGSLSSNGFSSLKYFTVLSNLFNGAVSLIYAGWLISGKEITSRRRSWKLIAVSAVGLTFTTVLFFLGPFYGYRAMLLGSNLWMHLILPVVSILSYLLLERDCRIPFRATLCAVVPTVFYEIGYLDNIALHGIGTWPDTNDFYGFLLWGNAVGAVFASSMLIATWLIAVLLRRLGSNRS
ncbi:MAG: hypothetical protein Q4B22_09340 [Eubacteriales bacterium]|nr:hypothetical protein [Eubacteriales bacterium]